VSQAVTPQRTDPRRALRAALDALGPTRLLPDDVRLLGGALDRDPDTWPAIATRLVWERLTTAYRDLLENAGWDVDLLPEPHLDTTPDERAPEPVPTTAGPAITVAVEAATIAVTLTPGHPAHSRLRTLPGASWNGDDTWHYPLNPRTAAALRIALTGHRPTMRADAAARLRAAVETPAGPDITVAADRIEIRFIHTRERQDDVKRKVGATWDGPADCWYAPISKAEEALRFAEAHDLTANPDVHTLAAAKYAPFDYDLTIDGLRGVPVTELHTVQAVPARGKTKSLADRLADFGVSTVYDALSLVPNRYLPRNTNVRIRDLVVGEQVGFLAKVTKTGQYDRVRKMVKFSVSDGTAEIVVTFFRSPWMAGRFRTGDEVAVYGRLDVWTGGKQRILQMSNPIMDPVGEDLSLVVPVYPQSAKNGITTWDLHGPAMEAVRRLGDLQDPLPADLRTKHNLMDRRDAYMQVHRPDTVDQARQARDRLAFDELLRMQLALGLRRNAAAAETGVVHRPTGDLTSQFLTALPFPLTGAQSRALDEIREDLLRPHPMNRLLQGDVGAGKTLVALLTLLLAVEGGFQGALMAPTEILASQLHLELAERLASMKHPDGRLLTVEFLANKTKIRERRRIHAGLADGSIDIVVGTHALLGDDVTFSNLGIVVIDEQHRFGVEQRAGLRAKGNGNTPDILAMTATPIPRTAAMVSYGDLSQSVLDELPPGRTPIKTSWISGEPELDVLTGEPWTTVREQVEKGRQAYVVASLVEDNENLAAKSAIDAFETLQHGALHGLRLGLVHGKQDRTEREQTMAAFKAGDLDVLIATTVIEVGVNVPNATVMVILDACRFGIAQLHQIRGRVGRGKHPGTCFLVGKAGSEDGVIRMNALCESTDGFYLSEVDLQLRGAGSVFGARQAGQTDLRVANLETDRDMIVVCRDEAARLLAGDPKLNRRPGLRAEVHAAIGDDAEWLDKS